MSPPLSDIDLYFTKRRLHLCKVLTTNVDQNGGINSAQQPRFFKIIKHQVLKFCSAQALNGFAPFHILTHEVCIWAVFLRTSVMHYGRITQDATCS
jgi:hypothetical protein